MNKRPVLENDDLLPEYDLDYSAAKPNHYAARIKSNMVILDDDVARVFETSQSVNQVLRALINSLPKLSERTSVSSPQAEKLTT